MPTKTRTFIAIDLPEAIRDRIAKVQEHLKPKAETIRWTPPAQLHITLAFLGDVLDTDLLELCRAVQKAAAPLPRFALELKDFGTFPPTGRPRVVWIGLQGKGLEPLIELQRAVVRAVRSIGYPPTDNRFHPHITIGRIEARDGELPDVPAMVKPLALWSAGTIDVRRAAVYSSSLSREGPVYAVLAEAPLTGQPGRPISSTSA